MNNAQWAVVAVAVAIALIVLGAQGGKVPFVDRAKLIVQTMFSGPITSSSQSGASS